MPELVRFAVPPPTTTDPGRPCSALPPAASAPVPPPARVRAAYDPAVDAIVLSGGTGVTLKALSRAVNRANALSETAPGEWLLGSDLQVRGDATLRITAPEVRWLKLRSDNRGFASLQAFGGRVEITGTCITSWDTDQVRADTAYEGGRSFILARDGAQLVIDRSELRFLGFGERESYGLSWRNPGTGGGITNSIVTDLYFGLYTYAVNGLTVTDNEFARNVLYGVDPHTGSTNIRIQRNRVHDNGKHGIILAEDCTDNVIAGNLVYRNNHHGIVLYLRSDRNVVEGNESFGNTAQGINVNESSDNVVRTNRLYDNESGVDIGQRARNNVVQDNLVRDNRDDGVRLVTDSDRTAVRNNVIGDNGRYGVYIDTGGSTELTANTVFGSRVGLSFAGTTGTNGNNDVYGNRERDVEQR